MFWNLYYKYTIQNFNSAQKLNVFWSSYSKPSQPFLTRNRLCLIPLAQPYLLLVDAFSSIGQIFYPVNKHWN